MKINKILKKDILFYDLFEKSRFRGFLDQKIDIFYRQLIGPVFYFSRRNYGLNNFLDKKSKVQ